MGLMGMRALMQDKAGDQAISVANTVAHHKANDFAVCPKKVSQNRWV